MKADIDKRHRAASNYIIKKLGDAMKEDYYDKVKDQSKTQELELFVKSILQMREMACVDQELAEAMGSARIG